MSIMGKKELQWVPLLGQFMQLSGAVFVDRGNNAAAVRSLAAAGETIRSRHTSLWMFPEGTRAYLCYFDCSSTACADDRSHRGRCTRPCYPHTRANVRCAARDLCLCARIPHLPFRTIARRKGSTSRREPRASSCAACTSTDCRALTAPHTTCIGICNFIYICFNALSLRQPRIDDAVGRVLVPAIDLRVGPLARRR